MRCAVLRFFAELNFADFWLKRKLEPFYKLFHLCFLHLKDFAGTGLGPNPQKPQNLVPAKISFFKVIQYLPIICTWIQRLDIFFQTLKLQKYVHAEIGSLKVPDTNDIRLLPRELDLHAAPASCLLIIQWSQTKCIPNSIWLLVNNTTNFASKFSHNLLLASWPRIGTILSPSN